MAITTYAELQTAIANWLHRADLTSIIPDFITLGEKKINRRLRVREMETESSVTLSAGTRTASLPTDYMETRRIYLDSSPIRDLEYVTPNDYWDRYFSTDTGKPVAYTVEGNNFLFGPIPDSGYTAKVLHYATPSALSASAHSLFTSNPDLYLFAALCEAEPYTVNDKRLPVWKLKFEESLAEVEKQSSRDRHSGFLVMRDDYNPY